MMVADEVTEEDQLIEAWALVDELGAYSLRLRLAADAALQSLGLTTEENQ